MKTPELKSLLSHNIKKNRQSLGLSQEKLAFLAGIDRTYMSEVERELANPTIEVLLKISNALGIPPHDLLKP
jgi:transcriptional regulator with XRE-family HTH domain